LEKYVEDTTAPERGARLSGAAPPARALGAAPRAAPSIAAESLEASDAQTSLRTEDSVVWLRLRGATPRTLREIGRIVEGAIKLADREGVEALSMRRLAKALDTGTTSLYRYVRSKDELLDLMVDAVMVGLPPDGLLTGAWRADFSLVARRLRAQILRHPWLTSHRVSRALLGPNSLRAAEAVFSVVRTIAPDITTAMAIVSLLRQYIVGAVAEEIAERETQARTQLTEAQWRRRVAPYVRSIIGTGQFQNFAEAVIEGEDLSFEQQFEFGLARLLDGIERYVAEARAPADRSGTAARPADT
jgi:AcrR family transcriptional regulator